MATRLLVIAACCLASIASGAEDLRGKVIGISDGDTLTVLIERKPVKVRLSEIDAPERKQPFGTRSRQSLATICNQKFAVITWKAHDRYGRVIGHVQCEGIDANASQVRSGMAWVYDRYASSGTPLYALQEEAKLERRGLWGHPDAIPPWEWRRKKK